jgi:formimidoylglutamate deiminase
MNSAAKLFRFTGVLTDSGWLEPGYVGVDARGLICSLSDKAPESPMAIESVHGYALPGFQNAHSHAFQYAMAGLAERHLAGTTDDFWSWREQMYRCALSLDPEQAEAVAAMLYSEMLRSGYTHVAEFHYLHHDKTGRPYDNLVEMGERLVAAAATAGIGITLIPVFYQKGGFGMDPQPRQKRFISRTVDEYLKLLDASASAVRAYAEAKLGMSVHSLRAVEGLDLVRTLDEGPKTLPFHIHVAEQLKEVQDCQQYTGQRPMEWLFKHVEVGKRFHMVHCTHLSDAEITWLAGSGASAVLCPSTEGNLGDGFFRMKEYYRMNGRWSIGTDSHIGLNPLEEFRTIDYRQRLLSHQRNTFDNDGAAYMVTESVQSGRRAMGVETEQLFATGQRFDALVADAGAPLMQAHPAQARLSAMVYTGDPSQWLGTLTGGEWKVKNGRHVERQGIQSRFERAMRNLRDQALT